MAAEFSSSDIITKNILEKTGVPLPCAEILKEFNEKITATAGAAGELKSRISSCGELFDRCGISCPEGKCSTQDSDALAPNAGWDDAKAEQIRTKMIDELVRQVVGVRIQNLYYGYNSTRADAGNIKPGSSDSKQIWDNNSQESPLAPAYAPIPYPNPISTTQVGTSAHAAGACNLFCDEGYQDSFGGFKLPDSPSEVWEGRAKDKSGGTPFDKYFTWQGPHPSHENALRIGKSLATFNMSQFNSTFQASGAIQNRLGPVSCGSWPIFTLNDSGDNKPDSCRLNPAYYEGGYTHFDSVAEYKKLVVNWTSKQYDWEGVDGDNIDDRKASTLTTFSWDDDSTKGSDGCAHGVSPDFRYASGMSAVHAGALVQALWMGLESVLLELKQNNGRLLVPANTVCTPIAVDALNKVSDMLGSLLSAGSCTTGQGQEKKARTRNNLRCNSDSLEGETTDCVILSRIKFIQSLKVTNVLECEVYRRAHELYKAFMVPNGKGDKTDPATWIKQLRNWAVVGCANDIYRPAPTSCDSEGRAIHGECSEIGKTVTDIVTHCFRFKYTTALKSYLENGKLGSEVKLPYLSDDSGTRFKRTQMQTTGTIPGSSIKLGSAPGRNHKCQLPSLK